MNYFKKVVSHLSAHMVLVDFSVALFYDVRYQP